MDTSVRDCLLGIVSAMRGEKRAAERLDRPDSVSSQLGAIVAPNILTGAYVHGAINKHLNRRSGVVPNYTMPFIQDSAAARVIEAMKVDGVPIRKFLTDRGIDLQSSMEFSGSAGPAFIPREGGGGRVLDALRLKGEKGAVLLGFKPNASRAAIEGITAHELGHAARYSMKRLNPSVYSKSKLLSTLVGMVGSVRGAGRDTSGREAAAWSAATALSAIPMLNEEIQASRLGSRLTGLRGLRRLSAFRGVPTYVATAALPGLTYAARKVIDRISGSSK